MKKAHVVMLTLAFVISVMAFSCGSNESVLSSDESASSAQTDNGQGDVPRLENEPDISGK